MRDPIKDLLIRWADKTLIALDELKYAVHNRDFWIGTLTFAALSLIVLIDGCVRRGV